MGTALVVGASGLVGGALLRRLPPGTVGTYLTQAVPGLVPLDLRDAEATRALVKRLAPDVVYQPAAAANVEWCEANPDACRRANVDATANLAAAAREAGATLVYFSTDYVFDGEDGPYDEDATPRPVNVYGRAKLEAERAVRDARVEHLVVRTTVVYGQERARKNFALRLADDLAAGRPVRAPADQLGTPTSADDLADAAVALAERGARGTLHVAGPDLMDRHAFARLAAEAFGHDPARVTPVATADLAQRARRPMRAGLDASRAEAILGRPFLAPQDGLRRLAAADGKTAGLPARP